ncbi:MAG: hypothetical protein QXU75_08250 [Candidatus Methanomethylicaceae archaeon]
MDKGIFTSVGQTIKRGQCRLISQVKAFSNLAGLIKRAGSYLITNIKSRANSEFEWNRGEKSARKIILEASLNTPLQQRKYEDSFSTEVAVEEHTPISRRGPGYSFDEFDRLTITPTNGEESANKYSLKEYKSRELELMRKLRSQSKSYQSTRDRCMLDEQVERKLKQAHRERLNCLVAVVFPFIEKLSINIDHNYIAERKGDRHDLWGREFGEMADLFSHKLYCEKSSLWYLRAIRPLEMVILLVVSCRFVQHVGWKVVEIAAHIPGMLERFMEENKDLIEDLQYLEREKEVGKKLHARLLTQISQKISIPEDTLKKFTSSHCHGNVPHLTIIRRSATLLHRLEINAVDDYKIVYFIDRLSRLTREREKGGLDEEPRIIGRALADVRKIQDKVEIYPALYHSELKPSREVLDSLRQWEC